MPQPIRQTEVEVGALVGATPAFALRVARMLKEAALGQWPGPGRGRRDAELTPTNFAYLALGLTHDSPIEAPTRMLAAGAMRLHAIARSTFHGEEVSNEPVAIDHGATVRLGGLPVAPTLVGTMSALIEAFAGETPPATSFRLDLRLSGQPSATLHIGGASTYRAFYQPAQVELLGSEARGCPTVSRVVSLWPPLFSGLAELWKRSLPDNVEAASPPGPAPVEATPFPPDRLGAGGESTKRRKAAGAGTPAASNLVSDCQSDHDHSQAHYHRQGNVETLDTQAPSRDPTVPLPPGRLRIPQEGNMDVGARPSFVPDFNHFAAE